jgi:hemoglobin
MKDLKEIENEEDIQCMVNTFYDKVRKDKLLSPIFEQVIQNNWPVHLEKMYRFWGTVLLGNQSYTGSPFSPHAVLPIKKDHFDIWLNLFKETVDENFIGQIATEAKWRAEKMAEMFVYKLSKIKENKSKPLL